MNYCENTVHQIDHLKKLRSSLENELKKYGEGELQRKKSDGKEYYYIVKDGERISVKEHPELYHEYHRKEQLKKQISVIEHNLPVLEQSLGKYIPLTPMDSWWNSLKSEQNPYALENKQNLYQGIFYRSKSEMAIAMFLKSYDIPYKYEVEVVIDEKRKRYVDFCIQRPRDQKVIYWEHCGLISKEEYQQDLFYKLRDYHSVGIDLWDNLVLSFDQYEGGLNADTIVNLIKLYLL